MATTKNLEPSAEKNTTEEAVIVVDNVVEPTPSKKVSKKEMPDEETTLANQVKPIFEGNSEIASLIVCGDGTAFLETNKPQAERWAKSKGLKLYEINSNLEVTLLTDEK